MSPDNRESLVRLRYELKAHRRAVSAASRCAKRISWLLAVQSASLLASWIVGERRFGGVVTYASGVVLVALLVVFQTIQRDSSEPISHPLLGKTWGPFVLAVWTLGVMLVQSWIVG